MQQVQQPLQQEEPRQSPLQKGNQARNFCLKMRFLTVLMGQNRTDQNTSLVHLCCQKQM
jgi:hypothetical protein